MYKKISKFLKIFFMCHCRADRSFFYKGNQFPICARCTGELIGMLLSIPIIFILKDISWIYIIMLGMPLIIDGGIQLLTKYESNNLKRVITGFLFGIAFVYVLVKFHLMIFRHSLQIANIIQPEKNLLEKYKEYFN